MVKALRLLVAVTLLLLGGAVAAQQTNVLTFEGLADQESVLNFYNGGAGGAGSGPGPNYGITFGSNALAIIESNLGGSGNFVNEPSPKTILFFLTGTAVMNVPAGFTTGFSFYYTSSLAATVRVYDGVNATGNVLATINLTANTPVNNCNVTTGHTFCNWSPIGATFSGTAKSIDFGGTVNQVGYDNITVGSGTPIIIPTASASVVPTLGLPALALLGALAGLIGVVVLRRRSV